MKSFLLLFLSLSTFAHQDSLVFKYWVAFSDKDNSNYNISSPEYFLSERAIIRRVNQDIPIKYEDIPVNYWYIDSIKNLGFEVLNCSKWFNGIIVQTNDSLLVNKINYSFVKSVFFFGSWFVNNYQKQTFKHNITFSEVDYGLGYNQIAMLRGDILHNNNNRGKGKLISVFDAGFSKANEMIVFEHLFLENRIIGTRDFVKKNNNVFMEHSHGMMVLSIMGAKNNEQIIGSSPSASYWLLRTEDVHTENLIEEYNWICAAEFSDSAGVDIINSSLGYTTFDNVSQNHIYKDMDGRSTPVSIGATIAARKGMIIVNSAGNSGAKNWRYVGAPADADSILSIGAVDENANYASFSSYGPSSDGRIKPTIVAQGINTIVATSNNDILAGSGTSFSCPLIAGLTACLWEAHPKRTNMEIIEAIIRSANLLNSPNDSMGYGLPNFALADLLLYEPENLEESSIYTILPNPITSFSSLYVYSANSDALNIFVYDTSGRKVTSYFHDLILRTNNRIPLSFLEEYSSGTYLLKINIGEKVFVEKVIVSK